MADDATNLYDALFAIYISFSVLNLKKNKINNFFLLFFIIIIVIGIYRFFLSSKLKILLFNLAKFQNKNTHTYIDMFNVKLFKVFFFLDFKYKNQIFTYIRFLKVKLGEKNKMKKRR